MKGKTLIFSHTPAGAAALKSANISLAQDLVRVMYAMDGETHIDILRGKTRDLDDGVLAAILDELERIGFVKSREAAAANDLDFTRHFSRAALARAVQPPPAPPPVEKERVAREAGAAHRVLERRGIYLAEARIRNMPLAPAGAEPHNALIVEDDIDQARFAQRVLELHGLRTTLAAGRAQLTRALKAGPLPSIVLLDVSLGDADGFDILQRMRAHSALAALPVVMVTVRGELSDIKRGLALGADGYIVKPYAASALLDAVFAILKLPMPAHAQTRQKLQQADSAEQALSSRGLYLSSRSLKARQPQPKHATSAEVLVVEDDPDQAALTRRYLEKKGLRVRLAGNLAQFAGELRRSPPSMVLLDAMLPDGDGFEILARLRKHASWAELPVLLLTSKDDPRDIARGLSLGADAYLVKPCSRDALLYAVDRVLKLTAGA